MEESKGKIFTIETVESDSYRLFESDWFYTDAMLEPVEENKDIVTTTIRQDIDQLTALQKENEELKMKIEYMKGQISIYERWMFNN